MTTDGPGLVLVGAGALGQIFSVSLAASGQPVTAEQREVAAVCSPSNSSAGAPPWDSSTI